MITGKSAERNWLITFSLMIIATLCLGIIFVYAQPVLIPFILAFFISIMVYPLLDFQVLKLKIPSALAAAIALCAGLLILVLLFSFLIKAVESIVSTAGQYSENFASLAEGISTKLQSLGLDVNQSNIIENLKGKIPNMVTSTFGTVVNFITSAFLVLIFVIFMVIGRNPHVTTSGVYGSIEQEIRRYLAIKTVLSIITGLLVWLILAVLNVQLASVFGMLAFLLNYIPNIGSIIATLLPIPVVVAQFNNSWMIVLAIALPGAVQMTIGNIVEPKLMGKRMNLHPIIVLMALSFWGLLWGAIGMLLAVPITAILRIILMEFETLKPVGMILAGKLPNIEKTSK